MVTEEGIRWRVYRVIFFLPENKQEWESLKKYLLHEYKDMEDSPETWTFILSQIQGVKMPNLTMQTQVLYAYYKRWKIAKVLQDEKTVYIKQLEDKLREKIEALQSEAKNEGNASSNEADSGDVQCGPSHSEGELPTLSGPEENMVSAPI